MWRRILRVVLGPLVRARRVRVHLTAQYQLVVDGAQGDAMHCRSTGDDPQFAVTDPRALARLHAGWWRLRWRLKARDGWVVTPKIYIDFGGGFREEDALDLHEPDPDGWIDMVVRLRAQVHALRLDPTVRVARFDAGSLEMTPQGRLQAVLRLFYDASGGTTASWGSIARTVRGNARSLLGPARGQMAERLLREHHARGAIAAGSYRLWYRLYDPMLESLQRRARILQPGEDRIALFVDAGAGDAGRWETTLESLRCQVWSDWVAYVALPGDAHEATGACLRAAAAAEPRVRVVPVGAGTWRRELAAVAPEALAVMVPMGSTLAPHATSEFAQARRLNPGAVVLYADTDLCTDGIERRDAQFKPEWNATYFASHDYIGAAWAVRVARLRVPSPAALDGDDLAACLDGLDPRSIHHIPKVLHHLIPGQDAPGSTAWRQPRLAAEGPRVSVVVPTRDRLELLRTCVEGVLGQTQYGPIELVVVDNGSMEPATLDYLRVIQRDPRCRVVRDEAPFNFSALVNLGVLCASGEHICLLNNDIEVIHPGWLGDMVGQLLRPGVGAVGAQLYYPQELVQHGGILLGIGGVAGHAHHGLPRGDHGYMQRARVAHEVSGVTAACMLVRRRAFEEVGGFDESLPVAFNDVDFCLRLRQAGWKIVMDPGVELYHHESISRGKEDTPAKRARFELEIARMRERWGHVLGDDPSYNPNLTLDASDFSPSFPPRLDMVSSHVPSHWWRSRPVRSD